MGLLARLGSVVGAGGPSEDEITDSIRRFYSVENQLMPERSRQAYRLGYLHGANGAGCDQIVFSDPSRPANRVLRSAYEVGVEDGSQELLVLST